MKYPLFKSNLNRLKLFIILNLFAGQAAAAGFQINPTASSVARSLGGNGIIGEDIGDMFFNPAGLSSQRPEFAIQFSQSYLKLKNKFVDQGTINSAAGASVRSTFKPSDDIGYPGGIFMTMQSPWSDKLQLGFGATVPFGLSSTYEFDWIGRYHATATELKVFDFNLAGSWEFSPKLMVGMGISYQTVKASFNRAVPTGTPVDRLFLVEGKDENVGFNAGLIFKPVPGLKLGLSYRSKVDHDLSGILNISLAQMHLDDAPAYAPLTLPESVHISLHYQPDGKRWSIAFGTRHTRWSRFDELRVEYSDPNIPTTIAPQNWENSLTTGISFDYRFINGTKLIASVGYDETPVPDAVHRSAQVPDADRTVVGIGFEKQGLPFGICDSCTAYLGFHRTSIGDRQINNTNPLSSLRGYFASNHTDVFSTHLQKHF